MTFAHRCNGVEKELRRTHYELGKDRKKFLN
jgi:hypothetical protein